MMKDLNPRLGMMLSFLRSGVNLADIGTDHAYLPIAALTRDPSVRAIASDIHEGPLEVARNNARLAGLGNRMVFVRTDGLDGLPLEKENVQDIFICGMGGETIQSILERSEYVLSPNIHLLLQPMTKQAMLRRWLVENGFSIADEKLSSDGRHIYEGMLCRYTGERKILSEEEYYLGPVLIRKKEEPFRAAHFRHQREKLEEAIAGRETGGRDTSAEKELWARISAWEKAL